MEKYVKFYGTKKWFAVDKFPKKLQNWSWKIGITKSQRTWKIQNLAIIGKLRKNEV